MMPLKYLQLIPFLMSAGGGPKLSYVRMAEAVIIGVITAGVTMQILEVKLQYLRDDVQGLVNEQYTTKHAEKDFHAANVQFENIKGRLNQLENNRWYKGKGE